MFYLTRFNINKEVYSRPGYQPNKSDQAAYFLLYLFHKIVGREITVDCVHNCAKFTIRKYTKKVKAKNIRVRLFFLGIFVAFFYITIPCTIIGVITLNKANTHSKVYQCLTKKNNLPQQKNNPSNVIKDNDIENLETDYFGNSDSESSSSSDSNSEN